MMDNKNSEYCIMDNNGMVLEKSDVFDTKISGHVLDLTHRASSLLDSTNNVNSIEIVFDNSVILIKDKVAENINMTMIVDNKN
jgi:hypothetical protein